MGKLTRIDFLLLVSLISLAPMLSEQSVHLWRKPHLQFFPLAWLFYGTLIYRRGSWRLGADGSRILFGCTAISIAVFVFLLAVVLYSPWLAQFAAVTMIFGWGIVRHTPNSVLQLTAWIALLAATVPLPLNWDAALLQSLQRMSTNSLSSLLDILDIPHLASGNVVHIAGYQLFVDEACSGIDSLYALGVTCLSVTIWRSSTAIEGLLAFLTVPLWAWFGNTLRLLIICVAIESLGLDLRSGWQHTLLGLLLFFGSVCCFFSTLTLFSCLSRPVGSRSASVIHKLYNELIRFPRKSSVTSPLQDDEVDVSRKFMTGFGVIFGIFGVLSLLPVCGLLAWGNSKNVLPNFDTLVVETTIVKELLPPSFVDFNLKDFRHERRDRDSVFGEHSVSWIYKGGGKSAVISLDFPFDGFHALEDCYLSTGQKLLNIQVDSSSGINTVLLEDEFDQSTYLFFLEFEKSGSIVHRGKSRNWLDRGLTDLRHKPLTFQLQMLVQGTEKLDDEEKLQYYQVLINAKELLEKQVAGLSE